MASINIRRDVDDKFYRYKMPPIIAKVEGKGNGIKTVIPNMFDIGKALNRPPSYPTKFFGCELGAQVICDEKNNRYIVNGCHDAQRLQEILDGFINKFVLCPGCKNPETDLVISKDSTIYSVCKACGEKKKLDQTHKLVTFILKTVPPSKGKKKEKSKDSEQEDAIEDGMETPTGAAGMDESSAMPLNMLASFEENLVIAADGDLRDDADADGEEDSLELFAEYVENEENLTAADISAKLNELGIKKHKALAVYVQIVFDSGSILEVLSRQFPILKVLCKDIKCQKSLLGGLERLLGLNLTAQLPKLPMVLKALYEADILEEDTLLHWAEHPSKKYVGSRDVAKNVRNAAAPFIDWLKTAESEEDSTEASDEE